MSSAPLAIAPPSAEDTDALSFMVDNPAFLSSDDAAACLHGLLKQPRSTELHWFILKSREGRFYCAQRIEAKVVEAQTYVAALQQRHALAVTVGAHRQLIIPSGFSVEASFHARPANAQGVDEATAEWVQRNRFFTIADLASVMNSHRKYSKCYLSARNGGLLSYTSSNLPFEKELSLRLTPNPVGDSRRFQSLYEDGSIPSSLWILLALAAGKVTVVVPGDLWRHPGQLKASWRSDILKVQTANKPPPIFGPICRDAKEVAVYLRKKRAALSSADPVVGVILKHNISDFLVITEAVSGPYSSFDWGALFPRSQHGQPLIPRAFRVHGVYHSIQPLPEGRSAPNGAGLYQNFFFPADLKIGLDRLSVVPRQRIYAITPDGAVLRFAKPIIPKVRELIAEIAQGLEQKIVAGDVSPQMFVDKVASAGILSVLLPSDAWPQAGRVRATSTVVATQQEQ